MNEELERLAEEVKLGNMGYQVINNEAFKKAVALRKQDLFDTFNKSKADEVEKREEAWRTMQNLNALLEYFDDLLNSGKMAKAQLDEMQKFTK